jgi:hypothetical protein
LERLIPYPTSKYPANPVDPVILVLFTFHGLYGLKREPKKKPGYYSRVLLCTGMVV